MENILIASSIVMLQYRKYLVQKGSLFNVTQVTIATKNTKKKYKTKKMAQNSVILGIYQVPMEQTNISISLIIIIVSLYKKHFVQTDSLFNVYICNYSNKSCIKNIKKNVKMAKDSQCLGLHQVLMEWKNIIIA